MEKFNTYFLDVIKSKYAKFDGRARREEYWYFILFYVVFSIIANIIDAVIGFPALSTILSLGLLVPSLAIAVRRVHDVDKAWWTILIPFYNLYLCVTAGDVGENQYGDDPKGGFIS